MQVIRQIVEVKNNRLTIKLPDDFNAEKVEVIVLPIEEIKEKPKQKNSERFAGVISQKTAAKLHKHLIEMRNEWERDIY